MASRFYFPSSGTAALTTVAFDAAWNSTGSAVRRPTSTTKAATAPASVTVTSTATNPEKHLCGQFVSAPLAAQTISGTITGQVRCSESNANFNGTLQLGIRVVSIDGTEVRGTLLAVTGSTTTTSTPPEFATSLTNRQILTAADASPLTLSSLAILDGDRLIIEWGVNDKDAGTSRTASLSFGDNSATDLTAGNNTVTTADNPWLEFNTTLTFQTVPSGVAAWEGSQPSTLQGLAEHPVVPGGMTPPIK